MNAPLPLIRRAGSTAGLLSSEKDGEALGAARALCRLLATGGLDPAEVVKAGVQKLSEAPAARRPFSSCAPVTPLRSHQLSARMCLAFPDLLSDWEREFVGNMVDLRHVSQRQGDRLNAIAAKVERLRR